MFNLHASEFRETLGIISIYLSFLKMFLIYSPLRRKKKILLNYVNNRLKLAFFPASFGAVILEVELGSCRNCGGSGDGSWNGRRCCCGT